MESIIGGETVTNPPEYPWMVKIRTLDKKFIEIDCGGSIISSNVIMTAAHCVHNSVAILSVIKVKIGHSDTTSKQIQTFGVKSVLIHPKFNPNRNAKSPNNIALLKLSKNLNFDLPSENQTDFISTNTTKVILAGRRHAMNLSEEPWIQKNLLNFVDHNYVFYDFDRYSLPSVYILLILFYLFEVIIICSTLFLMLLRPPGQCFERFI